MIEIRCDYENLTSFRFYNEFLIQIPDSDRLRKDKPIIQINMHKIEFIDSEVLPNFISLGLYIRKFTGKKAKLFFPWKPKFLSYLYDINFLSIIRSYDVFDLYEDTLGGFSINKINPSSKMYFFEFGERKTNIMDQIRRSDEILFYFCKNEKYVTSSYVEGILKLISELCYNGCSHSESSCILLLEYNRYKNKIIIAISDYGIGYSKSFEKKGYDFSHCINTHVKDLDSIIEAVYFREKMEVFGIHSVISDVVGRKGSNQNSYYSNHGEVKIHTNSTQIIFSENGFGKYLYDKAGFMNMLLNEHKIEPIYRKAKVFKSFFPGVHIEISVPIMGSGL